MGAWGRSDRADEHDDPGVTTPAGPPLQVSAGNALPKRRSDPNPGGSDFDAARPGSGWARASILNSAAARRLPVGIASEAAAGGCCRNRGRARRGTKDLLATICHMPVPTCALIGWVLGPTHDSNPRINCGLSSVAHGAAKAKAQALPPEISSRRQARSLIGGRRRRRCTSIDLPERASRSKTPATDVGYEAIRTGQFKHTFKGIGPAITPAPMPASPKCIFSRHLGMQGDPFGA